MKHLPWRISKETTPGEFVTLAKIRDAHDGVIAVLHADEKENGPLIAAAPELLAALETATRLLALLNSPGANDPIESAVFKARAVIAKAKGES